MTNLAIDADLVGELRALVIELAMPDAYQIVASGTPASDGAGGVTPSADTVIEIGMCRFRSLINDGTRSTATQDEQKTADRLGYTNPALVDLPTTTALTPLHRLVVLGKSYEVGAVGIVSEWTIMVRAYVQELT